MAPTPPQEQTPGKGRRSRRAPTPYVMTCASLVASSAGAAGRRGGATSSSLLGGSFGRDFVFVFVFWNLLV